MVGDFWEASKSNSCARPIIFTIDFLPFECARQFNSFLVVIIQLLLLQLHNSILLFSTLTFIKIRMKKKQQLKYTKRKF